MKEESTSGDEPEISSGESVLHFSGVEDMLEVLDFQPKDLKQGTYVLVEFKGGPRLSVKYRYACIIQRPVYPDESNKDLDVIVMSLKSIDESKKIFISKEEDVSFVSVKKVWGFFQHQNYLRKEIGCVTHFQKMLLYLNFSLELKISLFQMLYQCNVILSLFFKCIIHSFLCDCCRKHMSQTSLTLGELGHYVWFKEKNSIRQVIKHNRIILYG